MAVQLNTELRRRYWDNRSPLVRVDEPAKDRELNALVHAMAAEKTAEAEVEAEDKSKGKTTTKAEDKPTFEFHPPSDNAVIITNDWGAVIGAVVLIGNYVRWAYIQPDHREERPWLWMALDMIQEAKPHLMAMDGDPVTKRTLREFLAVNPNRRPDPNKEADPSVGHGQSPFATLRI